MNIIKRSILIFLILICSNGLYAQNIKVLTLNEAISLALSNNTDLITARYEKAKAQKKVSQIYNENLIPNLSFSSQYMRSFKKQVFEIFGQKYEIGTDNSILNTINVQQAIPFLGAPVFSGIRIAEYVAELQNEIISSLESKTKKDVKKAFYDVLLLKEIINVNELSLKNAVDNLNVVEARYRNGVTTEFDYLRAKVKVDNIEPALVQLNNNLSVAKLALKTTIGLKDQSDIDVTGKLEVDSSELYKDIESIISKITEKNVAIRQLNLNKSINKELVSVNNANFLPKLYVFGQYQLNATENDGRDFTKYRYYSVVNAGVGLSWDLNILRNSNVVEQSEIDVKKVDEQIIDVKSKLRLQAKSILLRMEDAQKRIKAQSETVKLAERGSEIAQISYKNGVLNQIDVLDAELSLNQSRLAYLQAIYDYIIARSELEEILEI